MALHCGLLVNWWNMSGGGDGGAVAAVDAGGRITSSNYDKFNLSLIFFFVISLISA